MSLDTVAPFGKSPSVKEEGHNVELFVKAEILKWEVGKVIKRFRTKNGWFEEDSIVIFKKVGNGQAIFVCEPGIFKSLIANSNLSDSIATNRISVYIMSKCLTISSDMVKPIEKPT